MNLIGQVQARQGGGPPEVPKTWESEAIASVEIPLARAEYSLTGFRGLGVRTRVVPGHHFGLALTEGDRKALIAFLKTL